MIPLTHPDGENSVIYPAMEVQKYIMKWKTVKRTDGEVGRASS